MSWMSLYMEYSANNESPKDFHWWTGLATLGATLGTNVYYAKGHYRVYPSLWIILIGSSGSGKTTSLSLGYNLLSKLDTIRMLPDRGSAEAITRDLGDTRHGPDACGVIHAPELATFLDKREHNRAIVTLLLRLGDFPNRYIYHTLSGGRVTLNNIAVTFLGATTSELLSDCVPPIAMKTGFLARFLCIGAIKDPSEVVPIDWMDERKETEAINVLYEASLLRGPFSMRREASDWYVTWYLKHKTAMRQESSERIKAYLERKPGYMLRVAMLLSVSVNMILEITQNSLEEAAEKLDEVESKLQDLYNEIELTDIGKEQTLILAQLRVSKGGITHGDLLKRNSLTLKDPINFKRLMSLLVESKQVLVYRTKGGEILYRLGGKKYE